MADLAESSDSKWPTGERRCEIELIDPSPVSEAPGSSILLVQDLRINGQSVWVPKGTTFEIKVGDEAPCEITMKIWPSRIVIGKSEG